MPHGGEPLDCLIAVMSALELILIIAVGVWVCFRSLPVQLMGVRSTTGQSWHLWCPTHGGHRGPILWGKGTAPVVPCPRCGSQTPDTFTKEYR